MPRMRRVPRRDCLCLAVAARAAIDDEAGNAARDEQGGAGEPPAEPAAAIALWNVAGDLLGLHLDLAHAHADGVRHAARIDEEAQLRHGRGREGDLAELARLTRALLDQAGD